MIELLSRDFGPSSRNRLADTAESAEAALETFYYALNHADLDALAAVWVDDPLAQLDNPVGGILRGRPAIVELYRRVFDSGLDLEITFTDAVRVETPGSLVVTGREVGSYQADGQRVPLHIRTTRVLASTADGWRLVHHHGSIDDAAALAAYQRAVRG
ncbi:YybH family protein [Pseudonocardia sp. CA-107938]|uniref:YybH family protein n=1 Tax=Pseudonocardia sp. CA-107938 TaxID=3240021 RepID=UPI003D89C9C7